MDAGEEAVTRAQAQEIAVAVVACLSPEARARFKAIDVIPRLHQGMLTLRAYFTNRTADDPEPFIFTAAEVLPPYPGVHDR